jgi:uncharacterized C2H2 Zn-finger protein
MKLTNADFIRCPLCGVCFSQFTYRKHLKTHGKEVEKK